MMRAAMLIADGELTHDQIAKEVGVSSSTITKWKRREDFMAEVKQCRSDIRERALQVGVARKEIRIMALNDAADRIEQIMDERAADPDIQTVLGGRTGLMKPTITSIGSGANALTIKGGKFDASLYRLYLATLEQARKEMEEFENAKPKGKLSKRPPNVKLVFAEATPEQLYPPEIDVEEELRRMRFSVKKPSTPSKFEEPS